MNLAESPYLHLIFWRNFWRNFLGGIFWEKFFGKIFLAGIFLRGFFWGEEFFGRNSLFTLLKLFDYERD